MENSRYKSYLSIPVMLTAVLVLLTQSTGLESTFIETDLYNYWALYHQFASGENPYNYNLLLQNVVHKNIGPAYFGPWNFAILAPLLCWSFRITTILWLLLNATALVGSVWFSLKLLEVKSELKVAVLAGLFFVPILQLWSYGQFSLLVTAGTYAAIYFFAQKKELLAAFFLCIACLKPHLAFLVWNVMAIKAFSERRWKFLISAICFGSVLVCFVETICPGIFHYWISAENNMLGRVSASLIMPIRLFLGTDSNPYPQAPAILIPCALALLASGWSIWKSQQLDLEQWTPLLLVLSTLFSPYIWPFDYTILLVLQVGLVSSFIQKFSGKKRYALFLILLLIQGVFLLQISQNTYQAHTYWFPACLFLTWTFFHKMESKN